MSFLLVLLVLLISTLLAVFIASDDFVTEVLAHAAGATTSRSDLGLSRTSLGLAISGAVFFGGSAIGALLVQAAFGSSTI